jgi:DNA-binding NtrC family response regulator
MTIPADFRTTRLATTADGKYGLATRFHLEVTAGPDAGMKLDSAGTSASIGTHGSNQMVLHDQTISRFHCEIAIDEGRAVLSDLGSTNGTSVSGVSVLRAALTDGAEIRMGGTRLRFRLSSDQVKIPLSESARFGLMNGRSAPMRALFRVLEQAAATDATVLIVGETGTGKELAAESIHLASGRAAGPFQVLDCSALAGTLLESELFGHERGAFTGAGAVRKGLFETASGGTLFLDEIGELDLTMQPALLRALEKREIRRVGGTEYIPVDVRIVAATHRDLRSEVNARRFRPDLYYRLAVIEARLPPLRDRSDDLPGLVEDLAADLAGGELLRSPEFIAELARHDWPGNVRELRNHLERCAALERWLDPKAGSPAPAAPRIDVTRPFRVACRENADAFEREFLTALLARHDGKVRLAASATGLSLAQLYRLLKRHGL